MENPSFNGCSDPAARTGCEVAAKVPEILLRGLGRDFAPDSGGGSLKGPGTHISICVPSAQQVPSVRP
jgi:hypothetical protein